jgi:chromosome partitioning protein
MRMIALITNKGGSGKTTLAASLAVAAADTGDTLVALDFGLQASLTLWAHRRPPKAPHTIVVEQSETARPDRLVRSWSTRLCRFSLAILIHAAAIATTHKQLPK